MRNLQHSLHLRPTNGLYLIRCTVKDTLSVQTLNTQGIYLKIEAILMLLPVRTPRAPQSLHHKILSVLYLYYNHSPIYITMSAATSPNPPPPPGGNGKGGPGHNSPASKK